MSEHVLMGDECNGRVPFLFAPDDSGDNQLGHQVFARREVLSVCMSVPETKQIWVSPKEITSRAAHPANLYQKQQLLEAMATTQTIYIVDGTLAYDCFDTELICEMKKFTDRGGVINIIAGPVIEKIQLSNYKDKEVLSPDTNRRCPALMAQMDNFVAHGGIINVLPGQDGKYQYWEDIVRTVGGGACSGCKPINALGCQLAPTITPDQ
jgi:hypothetical protein